MLETDLSNPTLGDVAAEVSSQQAGRRRVRLRLEYVTNLEAGLISWLTFLVTVLMFGAMIAACIIKFIVDANAVLFGGQAATWYIVHLAVAAVVLVALLAIGCLFAYNFCLARSQNRIWTQRRSTLTRDAALGIGIQIVSSACWMTSYALAIGRYCYWFGNAVAWVAAVRWTCTNSQFLLMLVMAHGHTRYRGSTAGTGMSDDYQLVIDAPLGKQLWLHLPKLLLWALMEGCVVYKTHNWLTIANDHSDPRYEISCEREEYDCDPPTLGVITTVLLLVFTLVYGAAYLWHMRRAFQDHAQLPFAHYRLSNMYLRVMVALALLVAVQATLLMPKNGHSKDVLTACLQELSWTQAGLAAAIEARDYRLRRTQFAMSGVLFNSARKKRLALRHASQSSDVSENLGLGCQDAPSGDKEAPQPAAGDSATRLHKLGSASGLQKLSSSLRLQKLSSSLRLQKLGSTLRLQKLGSTLGLQRLGSTLRQAADGAPGLHKLGSTLRQAAAAFEAAAAGRTQASEEPMFCLELAIRLWSWAIYSYRRFWVDGGMDPEWLMSLFGFTDSEALRDPTSDTHLVVAWKDGTLLLAFRGTASKANAVTDVKAWKTPLLPKRYRHGRLIKVHAGFLQAYRLNEEQHKLLDRTAGIIGGFSNPTAPRIFLTGHSLGGALAVLAAHDLARLYPEAKLTVCTFGAPKVGNGAFASEFMSLVSDSWAVINDQDPIPRIPTTGFRCCGLRVLINARGDILVRPSYFERSVVSRSGGNPSHHRMPRYALSLAQIVKVQFSDSKALPHGRAGAAALLQELDLGKTLLLSGVDLEAMQDPKQLPTWAGAAGPTEKQTWFTWCSLCDDSGASSAALSLEDAAEEEASAADPFHLQLPCVNEAAAVVALEEQAMMAEVKDDDAARDVETGQTFSLDSL
ncbi:Lipase [Chlorella vulgaris]